MAATIIDQSDLVRPLIEGIGETPPFATFMRALVDRTLARRGMLSVTLATDPAQRQTTLVQVAAPRAVRDGPIEPARLAQLGLRPFGDLRPGRVYAVEEMLDFDDAAILPRQRAGLDAMGIRHGRWMRVVADGLAEGWILLAREREDFSASAVAALSATAPYLAAALRTFITVSGEKLLRTMAQAALQRLGIGQIALDAAGRVLAIDDLAARRFGLGELAHGLPGPRLPLPPAARERLESGCAMLARGGKDASPHVLIDVDDDLSLLLQPAGLDVPLGVPGPAAVATLRLPVREDERHGAQVLRERYRLSAREAALAEKLSRGETIAEAGRALHLTEETARNYSKRIYARTGSRGQADLVRTILCGLAPLA